MPRIADAEFGGAVHYLRQTGSGHVEQGQQVIIPVILMDVVEAGAAGIGGVSDMHLTPRQAPYQEAVDGAEAQLAGGGAIAGALHPVKDPRQLSRSEVRIKKKTGSFGDHRFLAGVLHNGADVGRAPVLPDDGIVDQLAGGAVPDDSGFALVGDADSKGKAAAQSGFISHGRRHIDSGLPDVLRVMLDPATCREVLREFCRLLCQNVACFVKEDSA